MYLNILREVENNYLDKLQLTELGQFFEQNDGAPPLNDLNNYNFYEGVLRPMDG